MEVLREKMSIGRIIEKEKPSIPKKIKIKSSLDYEKYQNLKGKGWSDEKILKKYRQLYKGFIEECNRIYYNYNPF